MTSTGQRHSGSGKGKSHNIINNSNNNHHTPPASSSPKLGPIVIPPPPQPIHVIAAGSGSSAATPPIVYIFSDDKDSQKKSVKLDFDVTEQLGMGAFGVVKRATERKTGKQVAIKCIRKADCKPDELIQEVRLLRMVKGYAGIVALEDVYEGKKKVNIVMEYISGGELFDAIVTNEFYSEADAAELVRQIVTTVEHVHMKKIVHRDLKPENLLFEKKGSKVLKLIDFGIAAVLEDGDKLWDIVGSRTYMAPEINRRIGYDKSVDMYAVGVIMYILLCGYPPFDFDQGIYELAFNSPEWDEISTTAKDIIRNLLDDDGSKRLTATDLKNQPWVSGRNAPKRALTNNIHNSIRGTMTISKMGTIMARDRAARPRTSVVSMFAPETSIGGGSAGAMGSGVQGLFPEKKEEETEEKLIKDLRTDLRKHMTGFTKLKGCIKLLTETSQNDALKQQLGKAAEEINFLTNAYKELSDVVTPNLNKALAGRL